MYSNHTQYGLLLCALCAIICTDALAAKDPKRQPIFFDQRVIDAAMQRLHDRQQKRALLAPATQPARDDAPGGIATADQSPALAQRKMELLRAYDARLVAARAALRRGRSSPIDVRRLAAERAALQSLALEKFGELITEADQHNAQRLQRFQEAFGDLPTAARTVSIILMKSGQIDFATALPEDPITREVEEARGVRRAYFQFYLNPPNGTPRRHNGFIEFVYDPAGAVWLPTWADYCGQPVPLFDAEAFVPLRPFQLMFDGRTFVVAQAPIMRPPEVFALLTPRWHADGAVFAPRR